MPFSGHVHWCCDYNWLVSVPLKDTNCGTSPIGLFGPPRGKEFLSMYRELIPYVVTFVQFLLRQFVLLSPCTFLV